MRFHSGEISHKAIQDWNDDLQCKEYGVREAEEIDTKDSSMEDEDEEDEIEEAQWEDIDDGDIDIDGDDLKEEDPEDHVVADEGKKLNDNILAEEEYRAL
jgi:hypothetical protein